MYWVASFYCIIPSILLFLSHCFFFFLSGYYEICLMSCWMGGSRLGLWEHPWTCLMVMVVLSLRGCRSLGFVWMSC